MSVLQPYIDKKTLVVKSGQTAFNTVAILRWEAATAQRRMEAAVPERDRRGRTSLEMTPLSLPSFE